MSDYLVRPEPFVMDDEPVYAPTGIDVDEQVDVMARALACVTPHTYDECAEALRIFVKKFSGADE